MWRAALAATCGSALVGTMPMLALRLYAGGIGATSMLFWRYGLALVLMGAVAAPPPLAGRRRHAVHRYGVHLRPRGGDPRPRCAGKFRDLAAAADRRDRTERADDDAVLLCGAAARRQQLCDHCQCRAGDGG